MTPLVRLENVEVSYGPLKALDRVSFEITGGAVGLLGPNGAGKSTLLKALLGFVRAQAGVIEAFGKPMPQYRLYVRQHLGYMLERDIVSPQVSAVSFLTYCGRLAGMTRVDAMERAHEVLNYVGMGDNRYRKMETYSTGTCQRVKFAQALIHDPKLLLLDEPTNGLDPEGRVEMLELIRELAQKRGVAILLSSHLLPDVEHVCDRVIMINKGRVVRDGAIRQLTAEQDGLFEVRVKDNKEAFLRAAEAMGCAGFDGQTGTLLIRARAGTEARTLFVIARTAGTHIRHLRPVRHTLEEVFMDAMRSTEALEGPAAAGSE